MVNSDRPPTSGDALITDVELKLQWRTRIIAREL